MANTGGNVPREEGRLSEADSDKHEILKMLSELQKKCFSWWLKK